MRYQSDYTALPQDLLHSIVAMLLDTLGGLQVLQNLRLTCSTWRGALQNMPDLSIIPGCLSEHTIQLFPRLCRLDLVARNGSHRLEPASLRLLSTLKQLRSLRFHGGFTDWLGQAVAEAARCSSLTSLRIEGAKLAGVNSCTVLQSIGSMHWLQELAFTDVGSVDVPIVPHLLACTALQALDLQGCTCLKTEEVGMMAQHFPQLRHLNLSRCPLLDVGHLSALPHLEDLRLAGCICVSDAGLAALLQGCASSLTSLRLSGCLRLTSQGLMCLARAPGLHVLDISHLSRSFANASLPWLGQLPNLRRLLLNDSHMTRTAMHSLCMAGASLTALTGLKLARLVNASCMEDAWALRLASFGMLRALDLSGWHRMTDHGLSVVLAVQTGLQHLALAHCKKITDVAMSASLGGLLTLKSLNLSATAVSDMGLAAVSRLSCLEDVRVSSCQGVTDVTVSALQHHVGLRHLELDGTGISDEGLLCMANLTGLTSLSLQRCGITGDGLEGLKGMSHLKSLNLGVCWSLTPQGLVHIAACSRLCSLDLHSCAKAVTNASLEVLAANLPRLASINISNCSQVTNAGLAALRSMPALVRLDLTCCAQLAELAVQRQLGKTGSQISFPGGTVSPCSSPSRKYLQSLLSRSAPSLRPTALFV